MIDEGDEDGGRYMETKIPVRRADVNPMPLHQASRSLTFERWSL